jgi:hypothetical protein
MELKEILKHDTKKQVFKRFLTVLIIFSLYFIFVVFKYGVKDGILVGLLTWCFFVFCTPVADAGFLVGFPSRVLAGIRMLQSQILVYIIATIIVIFSLLFSPDVFEKTIILKIFKTILLNPIPYWVIIFICLIGTFLSVIFGDELMDVFKHDERKIWKEHGFTHNLLILLFLFVCCFFIYFYLMSELGLEEIAKHDLELF